MASLKGEGITRAILWPGAGAGGRCLTKDTYHLERGSSGAQNARGFWIELTPIAPLPCDRDVVIINNLATGRQVKIEHHPGMTFVERSITDPDLLVEMRWATGSEQEQSEV